MKLSRLATTANLQLAWRRITTGGNQQYKRWFRQLYVAYEIALDANLRDLRSRLLGGSFTARRPERVYMPKSSGLHRPLTLLYLEDQIVLQAFANLAAERVYQRRKPLQLSVVFSNVLQRPKSIFFFRRWQETYKQFEACAERHFNDGRRWVADFDLASFYDTVSHELLLNALDPKGSAGSDHGWLLRCLRTWSSNSALSGHGHGIPQGPIASDFLAECFLLPIDLALSKVEGYTRYVDDVRLFGRTENEVRAKMISLEKQCREHGLIPQAGKFSIRYAHSVAEARGMLPSIADPHRLPGRKRSALSKARANALLDSALEGRPTRVKDKTRLRYVLYRADPDSRILRKVLRLLPHHPEHSDAFFSYLNIFGSRKSIARACANVIDTNPYAYVRGEAWSTLAAQLAGATGVVDLKERKALRTQARSIARRRKSADFAESWGACQFLAMLASPPARYRDCFNPQQPLLQALVSGALNDNQFGPDGVAKAFLESETFEPGLAICSRLQGVRVSPAALGVTARALPTQVRNTLRELGVIRGRVGAVDAIAEILAARYGLPSTKSWKRLLGKEYAHALGIVKQAEASFSAGMSFWLSMQNSFHHAIFLSLQVHLASVSHAGTCSTRGRDGRPVDFGVMLDQKGPFSVACPLIATCFRDINTRRNHLPVSHPYEKRTDKRTKHLTAQERNRFVYRLRSAYVEFLALMP